MTDAGMAGPGLSVAWISSSGGLGSPHSLEIILKGAPPA